MWCRRIMFDRQTCIVTERSSTITSFVRLCVAKKTKSETRRRHGRSTSASHKSAPIVALYCGLNRLFTYWCMSDVLPTLFGRRRKFRTVFRYGFLSETMH